MVARIRIPLLTVAAHVFAAAAVSTEAQDARVASASSILEAAAPPRPGDIIHLASWREPGIAGEYAIADDGMVNLPLLGARGVTGLPADSLIRQLQAEYGSKFRNQETVVVSLKRRVRVLGAVREPGLYFIDPSMSVADAVALAGGATAGGNWKRVEILRDGRKIRLDLDVAADTRQPAQSGDQIVLGEKGWFSRNGNVLLGASISAVALIVAQSVIR